MACVGKIVDSRSADAVLQPHAEHAGVDSIAGRGRGGRQQTPLVSTPKVCIHQNLPRQGGLNCMLFVLQAGEKSKAAAAFQQLQSLEHTSSASAMMLGQLARASASSNPEAAMDLQRQLPAMPQLSASIDLDELEQRGTCADLGCRLLTARVILTALLLCFRHQAAPMCC